MWKSNEICACAVGAHASSAAEMTAGSIPLMFLILATRMPNRLETPAPVAVNRRVLFTFVALAALSQPSHAQFRTLFGGVVPQYPISGRTSASGVRAVGQTERELSGEELKTDL